MIPLSPPQMLAATSMGKGDRAISDKTAGFRPQACTSAKEISA